MMKKGYKLLFWFLLFGVVFVLISVFLSRLVEPKYVSVSREGNLTAEYYRESDAGAEHDVIFIGDCEAYSSFVPPILYEMYGIKSFVRGSPSQSVAQSYYLLREVLEHETPRAVVFSVYAMCKEDEPSEAYNRMTFDGMRLSSAKMLALRDCIGEDESVISYLFPLLRFHSRIFELEEEDIEYIFSRPSVSHNGYLMKKGIVGSNNDGADSGGVYEPLPQKNFEYLEKMRKICSENGVELILVKAPLSSWRYPWYADWDGELSEYASGHSLSYYSLSGEDIGLDMSHDSYDGGLHLNVYGAEKVSVCFGRILSERHGISGGYDSAWEKKVEYYYNERNNNEK